MLAIGCGRAPRATWPTDLIRVANDGDDQATLGGNGDADVDVGVADQRILGEGHVDLGDVANRQRGALDDQVVEVDFDTWRRRPAR